MSRSNRLVLLVGVFLGIVAFIGILLLAVGPQPAPYYCQPFTPMTP